MRRIPIFDLDLQEHLGFDKVLQKIQSELKDNILKLSEIGWDMKEDRKKLNQVKDDPTCSKEQSQLYKDWELQAT